MKQNTKRIPVKGTSRRVVIVKGENDSVFDQIIYIVRDDRLSGTGVSADRVLYEAIQSLHAEREDDAEETSLLFSRILLVLVFIALILTMGILVYLYFCGWS